MERRTSSPPIHTNNLLLLPRSTNTQLLDCIFKRILLKTYHVCQIMRLSFSVTPIRCLSDTKIYTHTCTCTHTQSKCRTKRNGGPEIRSPLDPPQRPEILLPTISTPPHHLLRSSVCCLTLSSCPQAARISENWEAIRQTPTHLTASSSLENEPIVLPHSPPVKDLTPSRLGLVNDSASSTFLKVGSHSAHNTHSQRTPSSTTMSTFHPKLPPSLLLSFWLLSPLLWTQLLSIQWKVTVF